MDRPANRLYVLSKYIEDCLNSSDQILVSSLKKRGIISVYQVPYNLSFSVTVPLANTKYYVEESVVVEHATLPNTSAIKNLLMSNALSQKNVSFAKNW